MLKKAIKHKGFCLIEQEIKNHSFNLSFPYIVHYCCTQTDTTNLSEMIFLRLKNTELEKEVFLSKNICNVEPNTIDHCSAVSNRDHQAWAIDCTTKFFNQKSLLAELKVLREYPLD